MVLRREYWLELREPSRKRLVALIERIGLTAGSEPGQTVREYVENVADAFDRMASGCPSAWVELNLTGPTGGMALELDHECGKFCALVRSIRRDSEYLGGADLDVLGAILELSDLSEPRLDDLPDTVSDWRFRTGNAMRSVHLSFSGGEYGVITLDEIREVRDRFHRIIPTYASSGFVRAKLIGTFDERRIDDSKFTRTRAILHCR